MANFSTFQSWRRLVVICLFCFLSMIVSNSVRAQTSLTDSNIDPRLIEIVEIVKTRTNAPATSSTVNSEDVSREQMYLNLIDRLQAASYSRMPDQILVAVDDFENVYSDDGDLGLSRISELYASYAHGLENKASVADLQNSARNYIETGSWFEKFCALVHTSYLHSVEKEHQAALQKAQLALSLIPNNNGDDVFAKYAKFKITGSIQQLHIMQGNSSLALSTTLDYLELSKNDPKPEGEVDILNNLIYTYGLSRNRKAQMFLSEHLLEIEKNRSSNVPGLSEMRIADVKNSSGRFDEAFLFAQKAQLKAENPAIIRNSKVLQAIALAGLGQTKESRKMAQSANVNFSAQHMLEQESRPSDLYLAFLLAQAENPKYATQLFNRQMDIQAQRLYSNSARDTTAMLAELENSRERQAEREEAMVRESALQALNLDRQKKLNRALLFLTGIMGLAVLFAILFTRYRGRVMRKLEIKTKEAASAEKLKTEFLGMISHELRTPLNGIIGISDYLANYHEDEDIREKTGIVLRSGNELLAVVESLTDMARIDAGQLKLVPHDTDLGVSLKAIPDQWLEPAKQKGLIFTHFIDPSISRHHLDEDRLVQCINILLSNAISFTDSGRVHLHITASGSDDREMKIVVADTGQGMSELVQSRLFTPFMQADTSRKRQHMGTGLSLAIAYALGKMMDGDLSFVSREGRGSEFTLTVPLRDSMNAAPMTALEVLEQQDVETMTELPSEPERMELTSDIIEIPAHDNVPVLERPSAPSRDYVDLMKPALSGRAGLHHVKIENTGALNSRPLRVLIVDDIASNRDVVRLILESKGHICKEAADGLAALSSLDRQGFDLVVLDVHMAPMDGIEALRRLRASGKSYANIPVVALTADNAARTNADCMVAGADLFLTKPVKREELLQAVKYTCNSDSARILSQWA